VLYQQKFDTFIRRYDDIGYIVNKSNYSDRIVDTSGAVFLQALSRQPKLLKNLCAEIAGHFNNVTPYEIEDDVKQFYNMLEEDGFILSGETIEELTAKDRRFSYSDLNPKTIKTDFTPLIMRSEKSTQEFLNEHFKGKPRLTSLQIELTSRCNERCVHCYIPHKNKVADIGPSLFYDTLEQCNDMGLLNLTFSGGEPLLHKNFRDFLRKAKEYDFSINILSNLTLLNDEILKEMKENRLSGVQVSLYSMKPEVHDEITQMPGSFYMTRDAILKLIDNDIPLQISCPTMKQNKNDFTGVLNWAHEHKVRAVTDYIMMARYDHTTDNLDNRLSLDEVGNIINGIIENDVNYRRELLSPEFVKQESRNRGNDIVCGVCVSSICMIANGNVYPCAGWQDYVCGNIRETRLREIWDNSPRVQYLRSLRKRDFPKCLNCEDRGFCAMCMVRNANENNDMSAVGTIGDPLKINEHFCSVAKLNRKLVMDWRSALNKLL
jgi:radical SAM protein with 4Fe4S-binding SPASM domain